jgi:hypothetical protein
MSSKRPELHHSTIRETTVDALVHCAGTFDDDVLLKNCVNAALGGAYGGKQNFVKKRSLFRDSQNRLIVQLLFQPIGFLSINLLRNQNSTFPSPQSKCKQNPDVMFLNFHRFRHSSLFRGAGGLVLDSAVLAKRTRMSGSHGVLLCCCGDVEENPGPTGLGPGPPSVTTPSDVLTGVTSGDGLTGTGGVPMAELVAPETMAQRLHRMTKPALRLHAGPDLDVIPVLDGMVAADARVAITLMATRRGVQQFLAAVDPPMRQTLAGFRVVEVDAVRSGYCMLSHAMLRDDALAVTSRFNAMVDEQGVFGFGDALLRADRAKSPHLLLRPCLGRMPRNGERPKTLNERLATPAWPTQLLQMIAEQMGVTPEAWLMLREGGGIKLAVSLPQDCIRGAEKWLQSQDVMVERRSCSESVWHLYFEATEEMTSDVAIAQRAMNLVDPRDKVTWFESGLNAGGRYLVASGAGTPDFAPAYALFKLGGRTIRCERGCKEGEDGPKRVLAPVGRPAPRGAKLVVVPGPAPSHPDFPALPTNNGPKAMTAAAPASAPVIPAPMPTVPVRPTGVQASESSITPPAAATTARRGTSASRVYAMLGGPHEGFHQGPWERLQYLPRTIARGFGTREEAESWLRAEKAKTTPAASSAASDARTAPTFRARGRATVPAIPPSSAAMDARPPPSSSSSASASIVSRTVARRRAQSLAFAPSQRRRIESDETSHPPVDIDDELLASEAGSEFLEEPLN